MEFFESTYIYFQNKFENLNLSKFTLDISFNVNFDTFVSYSYDGKSWSEFVNILETEDKIIDKSNELYVCIYLMRIVYNDLIVYPNSYLLNNYKPKTDKVPQNIEDYSDKLNTSSRIVINNFKYDNIEIKKDTIKFKETFNIVDEFPRWNFYDNQLVSIKRWLAQCNSICEMYGHTVIYFKTEILKNGPKDLRTGIKGTNHSIGVNAIRNVVDIKYLHIMIPNNELPQDRNVFTEWDMPLQDDFMIHIVREKFQQAFGPNVVPQEKDYLYFPLLNKVFRVSTFQPKNSFMGVIAWWEVFLSKYEEDSCVIMDKNLYNEKLGNEKGLIESKSTIFDTGELFNPETDPVFDEMTVYLQDQLFSEDNLDKNRTEEIKEVTQGNFNKFEDNTYYITPKETESIRSFYDKRLEIVTVNIEDGLFPLNMYKCDNKELKRTKILEYDLVNYIQVNKFSNIVNKSYFISFNYIILNSFRNEFIGIDNNLQLIMKGYTISIFDINRQETFDVSYKLDKNQLYQINIKFDIHTKTYTLTIYELRDKQKNLKYQNIYTLSNSIEPIKPFKIYRITLFGGNYLINDIILKIDGNKIIEDNCLPLINRFNK